MMEAALLWRRYCFLTVMEQLTASCTAARGGLCHQSQMLLAPSGTF